MKRMIRLNSRKKAMSLAVALIVLLVAGMIVGVSVYIVGNMMETTKMKTDNERRLNAAIAGVEFGKQQIVDSVLAGSLPKKAGGFSVTSADIAADPVNFSALVAHRGVTPFIFDETDFDAGDSSMKVAIYVYDLVYKTEGSIAFSKGFPPRMWDTLFSFGGEAYEDYLIWNPLSGGDDPLGSPLHSKLGYYLVRSSSSTPDGLSTTVEQSVVVQK